jgi:hypothetical protein
MKVVDEPVVQTVGVRSPADPDRLIARRATLAVVLAFGVRSPLRGWRSLRACSPGPRSAWTSPAVAVIACGWTSACHETLQRNCSSSASIRLTRRYKAVGGPSRKKLPTSAHAAMRYAGTSGRPAGASHRERDAKGCSTRIRRRRPRADTHEYPGPPRIAERHGLVRCRRAKSRRYGSICAVRFARRARFRRYGVVSYGLPGALTDVAGIRRARVRGLRSVTAYPHRSHSLRIRCPRSGR